MTLEMTLDITVDVRAATPPYEQIRSQIAAYVHGGSLAAGARLPTMRALAADLGVATGTVARAYAELETGGLIASRRRTGTVVTGARPAVPAEARLQGLADDLAVQARASGVDDEVVLAIVRGGAAPREVISATIMRCGKRHTGRRWCVASRSP